MRKIGLDVGSRSCGIALSDPLGITAQGKENYKFEEQDWDNLISHLKDNYLKEVDTIVLGYPLLPSGDKSKTTLMIEEFKEKLEQEVKLPIVLIDEAYTTKRAHEVMIEAGVRREKRKMHKDKLAAVLILQDYLARI